MSGSKRRFRYESDNGLAYVLTIDESNGEATNSLAARITEDIAGGEANLPGGLVPRFVNCTLVSDPRIKRKFIVGDPSVVSSLVNGGNTLSAPVYAVVGSVPPLPALWNVTSYRGEKNKASVPVGAPDTGLDDGDSPG